ncbi:MAG TPA: hypothetical protein VE910_00245 [Dongiaceae bacterium]|jgi:hypothetical protein|nr:hypothetical protein [Dongiaceae bacterium]
MPRQKECPNCATDIPERAAVCPICRYDFPRRPVFPWKPVAAILVIVLLVPLILALLRLRD